MTNNLFVEESSSARTERADRAVRAFRAMLPSLNGYAQALTGDRRVRIQISDGTPMTDGRTIYFRPPIALGDLTPHQRNMCEKRNPSTSLMLCEACRTREEVLVSIYHEVAHIAFGTFEKPSQSAIRNAIEKAVEEYGSKYADRVRANMKAMMPRKGNDFLNLSHMISPFLQILVNALEDARVDGSMFRARRGTKVMFDAYTRSVFRNGIEGPEGEINRWDERPLNSQALIGVYVLACRYDYEGWFSPEVEAALADEKLNELVRQIDKARTAEATYNLAFPILARLRELGFCKRPDEPEDDLEQEGDSGDESQESGEGSEAEDNDLDSSESSESGEGSDGAGSTETEDSSPEQPEESDPMGSDSNDSSTPEDEDSDAPEKDSGEDDGPEPGDGSPDQESDSGNAESDEPGPDSDSGDASDGQESRGERSGDHQDDQEGDLNEEEADSERGSSTSEESSGDGSDQQEEESDRDTERDSARSGDSDGDDTDHRDGESDDRDANEPEEVEEEPVDTGADEGVGGVDLRENEVREHGEPDEVEQDFKVFSRHEGSEFEDEDLTDQKAVDRAIVQGEYFETPSRNVEGVRKHRHDKHYIENDRDMSFAWLRGELRGYSSRAGVTGDFTVPEGILGPALLEMRRALADNARAKMERNLNSGRINQRVLGRRAWNKDERLFQKKRHPGKRSYAVVIGVDISGSTTGVNIALAKRAAKAQAELCNRLGIKFAVYCHTANGSFHDALLWLDMYEIKSFTDAWNDKAKAALDSIGPDAANLDGHSIEFYRKMVERVDATDKIILYYSDGKMPAENHDEELEILVREIQYCKQHGIALMGVGIRTDSPQRHGLDTVQVDNDSDLKKVVQHLERQLLRNR